MFEVYPDPGTILNSQQFELSDYIKDLISKTTEDADLISKLAPQISCKNRLSKTDFISADFDRIYFECLPFWLVTSSSSS